MTPQDKKKVQDAVFIITSEDSCPLYDVGEEIKVENYHLSVSAYKPGCLHLTQKITQIIEPEQRGTTFPQLGRRATNPAGKKNRFDCGGCDGMIHFEYKQEKDYETLQMKLLRDTEMQRRKQHLQKFFSVLRALDIFEALDDDSLTDLTLLLDLKTILPNKAIVKKGDPGSNLYIVLKGQTALINDDGSTILQIGPGEIFGEMSLLSGEPAAHGVHTIDATQLATMSAKNFKRVLKKYPILQMFLFKLLVDRAQTMTLHSGNITSGMTGELSEISVVDLFQLIHTSQKTGKVELTSEPHTANVFFHDGEIVAAHFLDLQDKDALSGILEIRKGHFNYARGIPPELQGTPPLGGFMGLMMEALQKIDEHKDENEQP